MRKLLSGDLLDATVGGQTITAQFTKEGGNLTADIIYINSKAHEGLSTMTQALYRNIFALAKEQGSETVTINAVAVTNKQLEQKLIANGWERTKIRVQGFDEEIDAFTKTFTVPE